MGKLLKNFLIDIKSKSFLTVFVFAFIIALFINPLAKLTWNILILWSNRFFLYLISQILDLTTRGNLPIETFIFLFVFYIFLFMTTIQLPLRIKKKTIDIKFKKSLIIISSVILLTIFISVVITYMIVFELNTDFKRGMGIIAPYINNEKEEELWAKWYSMESKIDYINLNHELENIAESNNLKLPK